MSTLPVALRPPIQSPMFGNLETQTFTDPWAKYFQALSFQAAQAGVPGPAGPAGPAGGAGDVQVSFGGAFYAGSKPRVLDDKLGERISVLDFGAASDSGTTDNAPAFRAAYLAAVAKGGCEIYIPGSPAGTYYGFATPLTIDSTVPVIFTGDGRATILKRTANMPANKGMIDVVAAKYVAFRSFLTDGAVTAPVGVNYSTFSGDPLFSTLTANTTFWLHDGCAFIEWENVVITHTGGYAILVNAAAVDITDLYFERLVLENNRPHLFGTDNAHLEFGSWTGGVLFHGNGVTSSAMVRRARFLSCSAYRCTGNCFWQHLYGFLSLHEDIHFADMHGEDIGLDFILFGGVTNATLVDFTARRVGYTTVDDTTASVPKWLNGAWGVAVDHSGLAISTVISNGTLISINGGAIDCDGMAQSSITNVVCRVPYATDPEYTVDQISTIGWAGSTSAGGPNFAYGIQSGNTSNNLGGDGVVIAGCKLTNISGGAIRMFASRNGHVIGNDIDHPPDATNPPISLGNVSTAALQRSYNNVVNQNRINWNPVTARAAIVEDSSLGAFQSGDKNWVFGNTIISLNTSLAYEFKRDANTSSTTQVAFSSNFAGLAAPSFSVMQREGRASDWSSALKFYNVEGAVSHQLAQLGVYRAATVLDPVFNVSLDGAAGTGVLATGAHANAGFGDALVTSKGYFDGFLAITDSTYADADANLLGATVALIRWNNSLNKWRQSVTVSAGARVWTDLLSGAATPAGTDTQMQYNQAGALGADANNTWDYTAQQFVIRGKTGAAAYHALYVTDANSPHTAFIESEGGFVTQNVNSNAIQAPQGGVTALSLISVRNDADTGLTLSRTSATARDWGLGVNSSGNLFIRDKTGSNFNILTCNLTHQFTLNNQLTVAGVAAGQAITTTAGYIQSAEGFLVPDGGAATPSRNYNTIQAPAGGMQALSFTAANYIQCGNHSGPPPVSTNDTFHAGALSWDTSGTPGLKVFDGANWVPVGGSGGVAGTDTMVQYNAAGAMAGDANLEWQYTPQQFIIKGKAGVAAYHALYITDANSPHTAYIESEGGFVTQNTNANAVNVPGGGVSALSLISTRNDGAAGLTLVRTSATARTWGLGVNSSGNLFVQDVTGANFNVLTVNTAKQFTLNNQLTVTGVAAGQAILVNAGYIQSAEGFLTNATSFQAIQAPSGGGYARSHVSTAYTQLGQNSGVPGATSGDTLGNGSTYYDSGTNQLRALIAGVWQNILTTATGAGVTSLNGLSGALSIAGTANQVIVTPGGSTITLSLPQSIATNSGVTFGTVTSGGVIQSGSTGASIAFQTTNFAFQVDGNGNISAAGSCNMAGALAFRASSSLFCDNARNVYINTLNLQNAGHPTAVALIDVNGAFVSPGGVNVGRFAGVAARAFNPFDASGTSFTGQDYTVGFNGVKLTVNGAGVTNIKFVGGSLVTFTP